MIIISIKAFNVLVIACFESCKTADGCLCHCRQISETIYCKLWTLFTCNCNWTFAKKTHRL